MNITTIKNFFDGKKTYAVATVTLGLAAYNFFTGHDVSEWVWPGLGAAGLTTSRAAVGKLSADLAAVSDAYSVITDILKSQTKT